MSAMEKEIGGYFGLEQLPSREYYPDLIKLNSARNALLCLIRARNIRKLYIPYFLCDSVSGLCERYGCEYEYYHIGRDFLPEFTGELACGVWLYVVNFYGQISNSKLLELKARWKNLIFDNVQAFFQRPVAGVDTIYSCRKFFGVPDGSYLAADAVPAQSLERDISKDRMKHILGRFEGTGSAYYKDFQENDRLFDTLELREMSALTQNILGAVDYEAVRRQRNINYAQLAQALGSRNGMELLAADGPYCYPFYCQDAPRLRKALAEKKIYVATLWPNVLEMDAPLERDLAQNILPLPCDQRYDSRDMERVIKEVMQCIG